ncbi:MAG: hypothetical protein KGM15_01360 [Pseudomonadota bacterium]|nr:hypothetical protein [Pseudomonadota bacterium]
MNAFRAAVLLASLALAPVAAAPAHALTAASLTELKPAADFSLGAAMIAGRPSRFDRFDAETARAARDYFDFNALVTIGALALAGGALAALRAGRARVNATPPGESEGDGHESVFQAMQADLAEFAPPYRRAA